MKASKKQLDEFLAAARQAGELGLVRCSSGNLSCRVGPHHLLVSASGSWMAEMTAADAVLCRLKDGTPVSRGKRPSIETGFHRRILKQRADVSVVLHFQSEAATAIACRSGPMPNFNITPETPYCIGPVAVVQYLDPGSQNLAEAVAAALETHDMVLMRNHGQVTAARDFRDALQKAVFFEFTCRILLQGGSRVKPLSKKSITYLHNLRQGKGTSGTNI